MTSSFIWRRRWFRRWLKATRHVDTPTYGVLLLAEHRSQRERAVRRLRTLLEQVHNDARETLREPLKYSLDPRRATDPSFGYPALLDDLTLQGYFGEALAGVIAENHQVGGHGDWEVPAFLFRFHDDAFRRLEKIRQSGARRARVVGRTGDDCLAFRRDNAGDVVAALVCEAKCSRGHRSVSIRDAHLKLSAESEWRPVDVFKLVQLLERRKDARSEEWARALGKLLTAPRPAQWERVDSVVYVCGRRPTKTTTWHSQPAPHSEYKVARRLEAIEVHLRDVLRLINHVYRNA
jgi:hypothetical protein